MLSRFRDFLPIFERKCFDFEMFYYEKVTSEQNYFHLIHVPSFACKFK